MFILIFKIFLWPLQEYFFWQFSIFSHFFKLCFNIFLSLPPENEKWRGGEAESGFNGLLGFKYKLNSLSLEIFSNWIGFWFSNFSWLVEKDLLNSSRISWGWILFKSSRTGPLWIISKLPQNFSFNYKLVWLIWERSASRCNLDILKMISEIL